MRARSVSDSNFNRRVTRNNLLTRSFVTHFQFMIDTLDCVMIHLSVFNKHALQMSVNIMSIISLPSIYYELLTLGTLLSLSHPSLYCSCLTSDTVLSRIGVGDIGYYYNESNTNHYGDNYNMKQGI